MKKVIAFAAFAILFASCSNVGKYKPMIEELASNWDNATSAVTAFANKVKAAQSDMASMNSKLNIDAEVMKKWDDATKAKFEQIKSTAMANTNGISGISTELDGFISSWTEKGKELQALKEGLANGKLEGDVQGKIASLTTAATEATTKLEGWQAKLQNLMGRADEAKKMLASFLEGLGLS